MIKDNIGEIDGQIREYDTDLCKPVANVMLSLLSQESFELWKKFQIKKDA